MFREEFLQGIGGRHIDFPQALQGGFVEEIAAPVRGCHQIDFQQDARASGSGNDRIERTKRRVVRVGLGGDGGPYSAAPDAGDGGDLPVAAGTGHFISQIAQQRGRALGSVQAGGVPERRHDIAGTDSAQPRIYQFAGIFLRRGTGLGK